MSLDPSIDLHVNYSRERQKKLNWVASLAVGDQATPGLNGNFITYCLGISKSDFIAYFKDEFFYQAIVSAFPVEDSGIEAAFEDAANLGKNGSKLYVGFIDETHNNSIYSIGVVQRP